MYINLKFKEEVIFRTGNLQNRIAKDDEFHTITQYFEIKQKNTERTKTDVSQLIFHICGHSYSNNNFMG